MIDLDERLDALADSITLPATTPDDDLVRGRARLRRRNLGAAGVAATTAAVVGTTALLLSGGTGHQGASPDFAGTPSSSTTAAGAQDAARRAETAQRLSADAALAAVRARLESERLSHAQSPGIKAALAGYRDILREDLDPAGTHLQTAAITNRQESTDAQNNLDGLGTKLTWNGGGMLQVAVGRSLEAVQFFCDTPCTEQSVAGGSKALVIRTPGRISVAVFQDDGDIVALTADTSFGNNGTSTRTLGVTAEQLLAAAADPRLDLPGAPTGQPSGAVGTQ